MGHIELEVPDGYLNGYDKQAIRYVEIQRLGVYTWELPIYEMDLSHESLHGVIKDSTNGTSEHDIYRRKSH